MEEFLKRHANKHIRAVSNYNGYYLSWIGAFKIDGLIRFTYISFDRATIMQHETSNVGKGNVEAVSVAIPAVMRAGGDGEYFAKNLYISFYFILK